MARRGRKPNDPQPMLMLGTHAKWSVCWVGEQKKKVRVKNPITKEVSIKKRKMPVVIEKDCGHDLEEAIRIYGLAMKANKPDATLVCKNVGFPPPEKFMPYEVIKERVVKHGRRNVRERYPVTRTPMKKVNNKGLWWCPYCRKFRKFQLQDGFRAEGQYVQREGYHCRICGISHRNYLVRRWNPIARRIYMELG